MLSQFNEVIIHSNTFFNINTIQTVHINKHVIFLIKQKHV